MQRIDSKVIGYQANIEACQKLYTLEQVYLEPHILQADRVTDRLVQLVQHARFVDHFLPIAFRLLFVTVAWIFTQRAGDVYIKQLVGSVEHEGPMKVVCFGGGASEFMALSGLLRHLRPSEAAGKPQATNKEISEGLDALSISLPNAPFPLLQMSLLDAVIV